MNVRINSGFFMYGHEERSVLLFSSGNAVAGWFWKTCQ